MIRLDIAVLIGLLALGPRAPVARAQDTPPLPDLVPRDSPREVLDEHLDAFNACDWERLMAQYPPEVFFAVADGVTFEGREAVGALYAGICKPLAEGGLRGLTISVIDVVAVDGTLNVVWEANADFLQEPYRGAGAYVTSGGLIHAEVSTFDGSKLRMK